MLPEHTELPVPLRTAVREHTAVSCRDELTWMKREAGNIPMRFANAFPWAVTEAYLAPYCTGRVFHHGEVIAPGDLQNSMHVTRHSHLMYWHDGPRPGCDGCFDACWIDVIRREVDVDKNRLRTAVADDIGGRNKRMADGDDFVPRLDTHNQQSKM